MKKTKPAVAPELLGVVGALLYGAWWQSPLARQLKVTPRTVQRWLAKNPDPPRDLANKLLKLCEKRRAALDVVILTLHKHKKERLDFDQSQD